MTLDSVKEIFGEKKKEMERKLRSLGRIYEAPCLLHVPLSFLLGMLGKGLRAMRVPGV